jgi:ADP-ribosyl-[dinitrogen reductase] hydrolase
MTDDEMITRRERFRGCLLGLAAGDAVGTTLEFRPRGTFPPIDDLLGGGPFNLAPGQWTDDTSMALCLASSLVETGHFDPVDQMDRYSRWAAEGYLSSTGTCFDIGNTISKALHRYHETGDPFSGSLDPLSAGNGCIMRLAPVPMFFYPDHELTVTKSGESSRTTHGALECVHASRLFSAMLFKALDGRPKEAILREPHFPGSACEDLPSKIAAISRCTYMKKDVAEIRGSGYVVESLEAALWCFHRTSSYREAVLTAANLGDDADTTAAICGQLAGACYGEEGIPAAWRRKLAMRQRIENLADALLSSRPGAPRPQTRPGNRHEH